MSRVRRLVVKIGSNVLTTQSHKLSGTVVKRLVEDVVELRARGLEVAIVTSGAVAAGMGQMGLADGSAHLFSLGGLVAQVRDHHLDRGSNYGGIPSPTIDTPNDNVPGIHADWRVWNAAQAAAQQANP